LDAGLAALVVALGGAAACTSLLGDLPAGTLADGGASDVTTGDGPEQEGGMDGTTPEGSNGDGPGNDVVVGGDTGPNGDGGDAGPDSIVEYSTGGAACVVKKSGALWCWGNNSNGTVGDGTTIDRAVPVHITKDSVGNALPPIAHVSAGLQHTCAVTNASAVYCWGNDDAGQLGDGISLPMDAGAGNRTAPHLVANLQATQVAAGYFHTCALTGTKITCWGSNGNGELGHQPGTMGDVAISNAFFWNYANSTPTTNIVNLIMPAQLSLGGMFGCANDTAAQDPYCWGDNYTGQLGEGAPDGGTYTWTAIPVQVMNNGSLGLQKEIASRSFNHGCAVSGQGALSCWGDNGSGQLGNSLPVAGGNNSVAFTVMTGVAHVSVSLWTTCIVDTMQHVQCWGANQGGILGHDPATDPLSSCPGSSVPCNPNASTITLNGSPFGPVRDLSLGIGYGCARKLDGTLWCWGQSGFLGNGAGDDAGMIYEPVQVSGLP
jgi:alpha-tubulin suppressor-like RCC1 family protein